MSLLSYSGITTKVRAMESRLISDAQFREMASLEDVRSAADFLKQQPAYTDIFAEVDDSRLHRGDIEQMLALSQYRDFAKLYRFSNLSQRRFLDLYFMHYEIAIVKRMLRHLFDKQQTAPDLSLFQEFFDRHSELDLTTLAQAQDVPEFISHLEGTLYHGLLSRVEESGRGTLFDYELQLDLFYFKSLWKQKSRVLTKGEQKILDACFGSRLDLLNMQWIYRAKEYYNLPETDIYALLIPVRYRLKPGQVKRMAEAETREDFLAAARATPYGRMEEMQFRELPDVEALYRQILNRLYSNTSRRHPYSIAVLDSYLYFKERELQRIVTTIEGIRYGLSPDEIYGLAGKQ
ncbi:MAG TPA: V-type ATPase subunit [Candidatus Ventrimonas merdavium]|nr:V-type ATPase subunit [Candidatus Ventrimonas merdavium]